MKKTIIMIITLSLFFMSGGVFAQKKKVKVESPEVKAKIESLILEVEKNVDSSGRLNSVIGKVCDQLLHYWNSDVFVSDETKRDVTIRLIKIFNEIDDLGTNSANKIWIIETIGLNDNSPEAHKFFLSLLRSKNKKYREHALWSLNPTGVHGDDIYDEIKKLMDKGVIDKDKYLYTLKSANSSRAKTEIIDYIKQIEDMENFIGYGMILCDYKDPELLDVLIDRYEEFKKIKPKDINEERHQRSLKVAFKSSLLKEYIKIRDGKKLKIAIEILKAKGISGDDDLPLWEERLRSKNISTRETILGFLDYQIKNQMVSKEKAKKLLKKVLKDETNPELKNKIKKILENF